MNRRRIRGFTLVELLVVVGIIAILAALVAPALIKAMGGTQLTSCIGQLRQIGQAHVAYMKDFDFWMVSCGAKPWETERSNPRFIEMPMDYYSAKELDEKSLYWYEALAPYINAAATRENAIRRYCQREDKPPSFFDVASYAFFYKREIADMCMLYSCPAKKQSAIGYGYNYAAPFGESIVYPVPEEYRRDYPLEDFSWVAGNGRTYPFPIFADGPSEPAPIPILWYGQSVRFGVITNPSGQIAVCDTGLVINDNQFSGFRPATEWIEASQGISAVNYEGYVRFPLNDIYTSYASGPTDYKKRYHNIDDAYNNLELPSDLNYSWRPVPRHNGRTACLFFDGNVQPINIMDIVSFDWGNRSCLFDNRPSRKPPCPKKFFRSYAPSSTENRLPERDPNDGSIE